MDIQAEYDRLLAECETSAAPDPCITLSRQFSKDAIWKSYDWLLSLVPVSLSGQAAVDVGCKYGHVLPLFLIRGASRAIGVDVEDEYLEAGRRILGKLYPTLEFEKSDQGYLPIPPASVGFVMLNEVISHVNPMYLDNLYSEVARILKPGGYLLISDGNNIANEECRRDLLNVYDAWENGPAGRHTGRDVVDPAFWESRRDLIRARYPQLPAEKVEYLARHTFGLFGAFFFATVDEYVRSGRLVERPFRPGLCPTNPRASGVLIERGFHPQQVELTLAGYGIRANQVLPAPPTGLRGIVHRLRGCIRQCLHAEAKSGADRGASWAFQILGVKEF